MELVVYRTMWGMAGVPPDLGFAGEQFTIGDLPLEANLDALTSAGADGLEYPLPGPNDAARFRDALRNAGLRYIAVIDTSGPNHADSFRRQLDRAAEFEPDQITCQGGADDMTDDETIAFFSDCLDAIQDAGIVCGFESHRQRALFTPWRSAALLDRFPELRLALDLSHWIVVTERLLTDEEVARVSPAAVHLQGRIGHEEGPQVADPRAPESAGYVEAYSGWWARIIEDRLAAGATEFTYNPEYGAPTYMPTLPYTGQPLADLEAINRWSVEHFRDLFNRTVAATA